MDPYNPDDVAASGSLFGLPHTPSEARVRVLGVPFQATVSYRGGTRHAPARILEASGQLDLCDLETGEPWRAGMVMDALDPNLVALDARASAAAERSRHIDDPAERQRLIDEVDAACRAVNDATWTWTRDRLAEDRIPAIVGGDHSVPLGAIRAASERFPGLGILHVDAHADLRDDYEGFRFSHASILHHVCALPDLGPVVQVGLRDLSHGERDRIRDDDRLHAWTDLTIGTLLAQGTPFATVVRRMLEPLPEHVWVTFDVDGLDPSLCPSTGTPVPGGLTWREALVLLSALGRSGRTLVGFDICEVGDGEIDAIVGARLLYKLAGWALYARGQQPLPADSSSPERSA